MHELDDEQTYNAVVTSLRSQLNVSEIEQVGIGNEFYIFGAELPNGPVVVKVPKDRVFSNANDAHIDSRKLLDQEFALMRHVQAHGIEQTPEPIEDIEAAGFGAAVMSYVASDDSEPDEYKLGRLLASIHGMGLPEIELSAQEGQEIPELIADRLNRRWYELAKIVGDLPALPNRDRLVETLESVRHDRHLLHMDFRKANFRMKEGAVVALLDWSNALIGHPALELARVAETGEVGERFLQGYTSIHKVPVVKPLVETVFRLDTATMLALVFMSEDPDPVRGPIAVERVRLLHERLTGLLALR